MGLDLNFTTQLLLNRILDQFAFLNHLDCNNILRLDFSCKVHSPYMSLLPLEPTKTTLSHLLSNLKIGQGPRSITSHIH